FRNFSGSGVTYVDAGPSVNQANRAFALGANSASATTIDFGADVLQFVYTNVPASPVIIIQPKDQAAFAGGSARFTVVASGTFPLSYQWKLGETELPGATNSSLSLSNVQSSDVGTYTVNVANEFGSVTSAGALLTVTNAPPPTIVTQPRSQAVNPGN